MADEDGEVVDVAGDMETVISDADADVLITEAVRRREDQRSGRSMGRQLRPVAGCVAAGLLLIVGGGVLGHGMAAAALVAGVFIMAVAGLPLLRALDLSPASQWGEVVAEACPACGERGLREGPVAISGTHGIVALCTPECGYADVRPDPDRSPEASGTRKTRRDLVSRVVAGARGHVP